ncbi:unnamed protein product [Allacma fusca]|uniref:Uncharacterized protein n=1 Tax=Allacma fusca TaxID=39272 RepID=A0A8J2L404_9HEXA|nr:unnamed protein product [Allacma fusca]
MGSDKVGWAAPADDDDEIGCSIWRVNASWRLRWNENGMEMGRETHVFKSDSVSVPLCRQEGRSGGKERLLNLEKGLL